MPQTTIQCMRYARRITKAIDMCLKCAILIACTRQQLLREHSSILHYMYNVLCISHVHSMILSQ